MEFIPLLLGNIVAGGPAAIITILLILIAGLVWDRKRLTKEVDDSHDDVIAIKDNETKMLREVVDRYHQGNIDIIQALNEIRMVLVTIQNVKG